MFSTGCTAQMQVRSRQQQRRESRISRPFFSSDQKTLISVQLRGTAKTAEEGTDEHGALAQMMAADNDIARWAPPIAKVRAGEYAIVKITPTWLRYADFTKGSEGSDDCFVQIIG